MAQIRGLDHHFLSSESFGHRPTGRAELKKLPQHDRRDRDQGDVDDSELASLLDPTRDTDATEQSPPQIPMEPSGGKSIRPSPPRVKPAADSCDATFLQTHTEDDKGLDLAEGRTNGEAKEDEHQRYRKLRKHARGGLGEVFVALDQQLNREVALKEIQDKCVDHAESRQRFLLEAEITGRLEHPGIVPVYGLGQHEGGRPFYAMRFVDGQSLRQAIKKFFKQVAVGKIAGPGYQSVQWRRLLSQFVSVCQAIDYAHSRGVIHRDIKPANVMIGRFGETLVVDWGLAKICGRSESDSLDSEETLRPQSGDDSSQTRAGSTLGTPAFMSPEQARGDVNAIGPASDIYSLGATLYFLLTGKPPFASDELANTIERVCAGRFPTPLEVEAKCPKPLNAICLRAMTLARNERYESARQLAEDLELWLADEPVGVYAGGISERAGRWMRRNRGVAASAAVSLTLITLLSLIAAFVFMRQESIADGLRMRAQTAQAKAERAREEANFRRQLAVQAAQREKQQRERAEALSRDKQAMAQQEKQLREQSDQLAVKFKIEADRSTQLSDFLVRTFQAADPVGQGMVGFLPKANTGSMTIRELLDLSASRLEQDKTLDPLTRATMLNAIGNSYRQLGLLGQSEAILVQALQLRRAELPENSRELAESLHNLGWHYHETGDYPRAEELYREALAIRSSHSGKAAQIETAATRHNIAWLLANSGETDDAIKLFEATLAERIELLGEEHRDTVFSRLGLCFTLFESNRHVPAVMHLFQVKDNVQSIDVDDNIRQAVWKFAIALLLQDPRGKWLEYQFGSAETNMRGALESVLKSLDENHLYVLGLRTELAKLLLKQKRYEEAEAEFDFVLPRVRKQTKMQHPRCLILVGAYAKLLKETGRSEQGRAEWQALTRAFTEKFGETNKYVIYSLNHQRRFLRSIGNHLEAAEVIDRIVRSLEKLDPADVTETYGPQYWGYLQNQKGVVLENGGQREYAAMFYRNAIFEFNDHMETPTAAATERIYPQANLAICLKRLGRIGDAVEVIDQANASGQVAAKATFADSEALEYLHESGMNVAKEAGDSKRFERHYVASLRLLKTPGQLLTEARKMVAGLNRFENGDPIIIPADRVRELLPWTLQRAIELGASRGEIEANPELAKWLEDANVDQASSNDAFLRTNP